MQHVQQQCVWCGSPLEKTPRFAEPPRWLCVQCDSDYRADVDRPAALFEVRQADPVEGR